MDTDELRRANLWAQLAFHQMVSEGVYGNPKAAATLRYIDAEQRVRVLIEDDQWETAKAAMDALIAADHDLHDEPDPTCADCQEASAAMWTRMAAL